MGKLLEQWLAENSQALARLQPGGGMPGVGAPPPPAFPGQIAPGMMPEQPPAFPGAGPTAAPVEIGQPPPTEMGEFAPFQPQPMQAPAFPEEAAGGDAALGSAVMEFIDMVRGEEEPQGPPIPGSPEEQAMHMPPQGAPPALPPGATGQPPPGAFAELPPEQQGPVLPPGTEGIQPGGELAQPMPGGPTPPGAAEGMAQPVPGGPTEPGAAEGMAQPLDSYTAEGQKSAFKEGEIESAEDALKAAPEAVDKSMDVMEQQTGVPVEETYEKLTGSPPPANMKRRAIGEFLFEFGLNLLAAPPGGSDVGDLGRGLQQTIAGRQGRAQRQQTQARTQQIEERDYQIELRKLGLKEREIEAMESGARGGSYADFTGEDGYLYTYDRRTHVANRVVGPDGKPIKSQDKGTGTTGESVQRYNATIDAWKQRAQILGIEYGGEYELDALTAAENRLIGTRPQEMTDEQRRTAAMEEANSVTKTTEYLYATPEERRAMVEEARRDAYNYLKYGDQMEPVAAPAGGAPEASRLQSGAATPVTDEAGNVTYWTLGTDGQPRQVSDEEMSGQ